MVSRDELARKYRSLPDEDIRRLAEQARTLTEPAAEILRTEIARRALTIEPLSRDEVLQDTGPFLPLLKDDQTIEIRSVRDKGERFFFGFVVLMNLVVVGVVAGL